MPYNPYEIISNGLNSPDRFPRDILDYMLTVDTGRTVYTQKMLTAYVTGPLFELPAGSVEAVVGIEGRRESINDTPGPITLHDTGWHMLPMGITAGTDTVREMFAEFELPVLRDRVAAQDLIVNIAGRYSNYG